MVLPDDEVVVSTIFWLTGFRGSVDEGNTTPKVLSSVSTERCVSGLVMRCLASSTICFLYGLHLRSGVNSAIG